MKLSGIEGGHHVGRDSEFSSLAEVPRCRSGALVPITDQTQIGKLVSDGFKGCMIVTENLMSMVPDGVGAIISERPLDELYDIHNSLVRGGSFYSPPGENVIDSDAEIHQTSVIAGSGVSIGKGCIIGPKVTILAGSTIEDNVTIGPGTVIGSEEVVTLGRGAASEKVLSSGGVTIGKDVGIHANSSINRAVLGGSTEIRAGAKFDNLVKVGQNAKIGERSFVAACASIGPNVDIGEEVWIGPNSTVGSGLTIGNRAYVTIGSVVVKDVAEGKLVTGHYTMDYNLFAERLKKR